MTLEKRFGKEMRGNESGDALESLRGMRAKVSFHQYFESLRSMLKSKVGFGRCAIARAAFE